MAQPIVTFDAGQTLVELDLDFLATRLTERGSPIAVAELRAAAPAAWRRYDEVIDGGEGHPWRELMTALLAGAGVADAAARAEWLWAEQPLHNLWRQPIAGMVELARDLAARGVPLVVVSNSEGRLAELLTEIGIGDPFIAVIDSGRLGIEKPDPRIFAAALAAVGATTGIHVGDSWSADIEGARAAGWRSIWFTERGGVAPFADPNIRVAHDPREVRAALAAFGVESAA